MANLVSFIFYITINYGSLGEGEKKITLGQARLD
jgi:hypothetical protein